MPKATLVHQLERQIKYFFYERLLATQSEEQSAVKNEIQTLEPNTAPRYILKDPYILELLNLKQNNAYYEKNLELELWLQMYLQLIIPL